MNRPSPVQSTPQSTVMREALERAGMVRNDRPCGTCRHYRGIGGGLALCDRFKTQVTRPMKATRKADQPTCWQSKY